MVVVIGVVKNFPNMLPIFAFSQIELNSSDEVLMLFYYTYSSSRPAKHIFSSFHLIT